MQHVSFSVAVIRTATGRSEVVSRPGHLEPHSFARDLEIATGGKVISVRHEQVGQATVATFSMESR